METDMQALARDILEEGRKVNLFSAAITVDDIQMVLEKCLYESDDQVLTFHRK